MRAGIRSHLLVRRAQSLGFDVLLLTFNNVNVKLL